jgi:hypothetical protein
VAFLKHFDKVEMAGKIVFVVNNKIVEGAIKVLVTLTVFRDLQLTT